MYYKIPTIVFLFFHIAFSETLYVPDDFNSIQGAIDASENSDTILVDPGIYFENINFNGKSIVLSSKYLLNNDSLLIGITIIDA